MQSRLQGLQEGIKERDRNLARMKEQVKYYIAFAEHSARGKAGIVADNEVKDLEVLVKELQDAKEEVRSLSSHNSELQSQLQVLSSRTRENSSAGLVTPDHESIENGHESLSTTSSSSDSNPDTNHVEVQESSDSSPTLSKDVAMLKVEHKFKTAMQRVAELTIEKEQMEHLIGRLQDETDTVGEYITIYQYQRAQQKAQLQEKEQQLHSVARDREELKSKLAQLQALLATFLKTEPEEQAGQEISITEGDFVQKAHLLAVIADTNLIFCRRRL